MYGKQIYPNDTEKHQIFSKCMSVQIRNELFTPQQNPSMFVSSFIYGN